MNNERLPALGSCVMRTEKSGVRLITDAVAVCRDRQDTLLLVSGAGPESSVKAVAGGLRSNARVEFVIDHPGCHRKPRRHENGYKVFTARLEGNYWHVLIIADMPGFLPILDDESLWQELRSDRFTTPLLREWVPWLRQEMESRYPPLLAKIHQAGCSCGLLTAKTEDLDQLVKEGLTSGQLRIPISPTQGVPKGTQEAA